MRIIGGKFKGYKLNAPYLEDARPTTDKARESLFNILEHQIDWDKLEVLDLFCGTGSIAFEMMSRGTKICTVVDTNMKALHFIRDQAKKWECEVRVVKSDVFRFLLLERKSYDFIFADPPYSNKHIAEIPDYVFNKKLLNQNGVLIVEHGKETDLSQHPNFESIRNYGRVHFSFFKYS